MNILAKSLLLCTLSQNLILQGTQAAELTADKMEFTRGAQVATGNAELRDNDLILRASKISYKDDIAHAEGQITLKNNDVLITGESLEYSLKDGSFKGKKLQVGKWPVYIEAEEITGDTEKYEAEGAMFYYGEPELYSPAIKATSIGYRIVDERYYAKDPWLTLGNRPILPLPGGSIAKKHTPFAIYAEAGIRQFLGAYLVVEPSILQTDNYVLTPGVGLYQERGVMLKPRIDYNLDLDGNSKGGFEVSWIRDQTDDPPFLAPELPDHRYYVDWRHQFDNSDNVDAKIKLNWLSDADYLRDFERDFFHDNFADSFAEASYHQNNLLLSTFARINPDDVQGYPRRLPDLRADLLTSKLGNTPIQQRGHMAMAWLEEDTASIQSTRFDAYYGLSHKFATPAWFSVTPIAGGRVTRYISSDTHASPYTRTIGELGGDIEIYSHGNWDLNSPLWRIEGLRHILKAIAQYRYIPESEDGTGRFAELERSLLQHNMPLIGLGMLPYLDQLGDQHTIRLGLENRFDTKHSAYGTRRLAQLNLYQDIFPDRPTNKLEALYINLLVSPASWIDFGITGKLPSATGELSQLSTGFILRDGDKADLYYANEYLVNGVHQNSVYITYQLNRNNQLAAGIRHDSDNNVLTEQVYTWSRSLGKNWILDNTVILRDGNLREYDYNYRLGLRLREY